MPENLEKVNKQNQQAAQYELIFERTLGSIKTILTSAPRTSYWSDADCKYALELTDRLAMGWYQHQPIQTQLNAIKALTVHFQPPERTVVIASLAAIESWTLELQEK